MESEGERTLSEVKKMGTGVLLEYVAGMKENTVAAWVGKYELERRKNQWNEIRSWITVGISIVALLTSFYSITRT